MRPAFSAASMAIKIRRSCGIRIATRSRTCPPELDDTLGKAVSRFVQVRITDLAEPAMHRDAIGIEARRSFEAGRQGRAERSVVDRRARWPLRTESCDPC